MNIQRLLNDNTVWLSVTDSYKIDKLDIDDYRLHHLDGILERIYFLKTFEEAYEKYKKLMGRPI